MWLCSATALLPEVSNPLPRFAGAVDGVTIEFLSSQSGR